MAIPVRCPKCSRMLRARDEFAGSRAECPDCGSTIEIPEKSSSQQSEATAKRNVEPVEITEFLDPPGAEVAPEIEEPSTPVLQRMFEALLDPRAIHWMLTIGGGLAVLGLIIWLVSIGLFKNALAVAGVLGAGSLGVLGLGWWVTLKTSHKTAGRALTFLGCVVAPLNLWYYQSQNLMTIDNHLWIGGVVCLALYAATVRMLKDPLFLYAVECGVTLTVFLFAADMNVLTDWGITSIILAVMAAISIHAERLFNAEGEFNRKDFGLPLFWSGHAQLAVSLGILAVSQGLDWLQKPFAMTWAGNVLTDNSLLAGAIWMAATYLYLYSDLIVRKRGWYTYLAGACILMAEVTLLLPYLADDMVIAALAITALIIQFVVGIANPEVESADDSSVPNIKWHASIVAMVMSVIPVFMGLILHFRAIDPTGMWAYETSWSFVIAMMIVTVTNRISAHLTRHVNEDLSMTHFVFSASAAIVTVAGLLRELDVLTWSHQAPYLMLLPIAYIVGARLWRGHSAERPLAVVGHFATAMIMIGTFSSAMNSESGILFTPKVDNTLSLWLGVTFLEATLFYGLAGFFRRKSWNAYYATVAACAAIWQFMGYYGVDRLWHTPIFAVLGVGMIIVSRAWGINFELRYDHMGDQKRVIRGPGGVLFRCGNVILTTSMVLTILRGLVGLSRNDFGTSHILMLVGMTAVSVAAAIFLSLGNWKRVYTVTGVVLAALTLQALNQLIDLTNWQKFEIFSVTAGVLILVVSHVTIFRNPEREDDDAVTMGLWAGSLAAVLPLFMTMFSYRFLGTTPSLYDELALLTVTILMVVLGCSWQVKATTLIGGTGLVAYLVLLIGSLAYRPEVAVGVYLLVGGGVIFASGVALSLYRDHLLKLPEMISRREGIFRVINWR